MFDLAIMAIEFIAWFYAILFAISIPIRIFNWFLGGITELQED
jgi:hypothetical protein